MESGVGEPSLDRDSGVMSPDMPTWLGDAGADLYRQASQEQPLHLISLYSLKYWEFFILKKLKNKTKIYKISCFLNSKSIVLNSIAGEFGNPTNHNLFMYI